MAQEMITIPKKEYENLKRQAKIDIDFSVRIKRQFQGLLGAFNPIGVKAAIPKGIQINILPFFIQIRMI